MAVSGRPDPVVDKNPDGIVIHIAHPLPLFPHVIVLQALSPRIVHVTAYPTDQATVLQSLILVDKPGPAPHYTVQQTDSVLTFSTDSLKVLVSLTTGRVSVYDNLGHPLLKEAARDTPPFARNTGENAWSLSTTFQTSPEESLYGLGQQQNGFMDYQGRSVALVQQNTSVAVPFVLSSNNYGLLWDNYSITHFGDLRSYMDLSGLNIKDDKGNPGSLTATYGRINPNMSGNLWGADPGAQPKDIEQPAYNQTSFAGAPVYGQQVSGDSLFERIFTQRPETAIAYDYLEDSSKFPKGYTLQNGLVRWAGTISAKTTGLHQFLLYSGGYVRVWINGELKVNRWRQCWNPATTAFDVHLQKGRETKIAVEWQPDGTQSFISLRCLPPGQPAYKNTYSFSSEVGDAINYYVIKGDNPDEVIAGYRALTGQAPLMPEWATGLWQSRERYKTQEEILSTVKEFRNRHIPLDNIVLDWQYWRPDQWGSQDFDSSRFPEPAQMISTLHDSLHAHFMISVWPKFYAGTRNFNTFNQKGYLYTQSVNWGQKDWIGYVSTFYDAFNPAARHDFWDLMNRHLFYMGIDGWWMDATEPDINSNASIRERKALMTPHSGGSSSRYFNAFPLENARAVYEGQRAVSNQRVFILTRSAFAGQQRYAAATWSGDIGSRWEDMRGQITAGLNFCLSGIPYWTMDAGGFAVEGRYYHPSARDKDEWMELNTRWYQFAAFCPLMRVHGQFPFRELFHIAPEGSPAYNSMLYYDQLRYLLQPYIYSLWGKTWYGNYTLMRALVMDFEGDSIARKIPDQYMFGPSFLVNPVYTYQANKRKVYLPAGPPWYEAYTGQLVSGGRWIDADAPYGRMPLYVKAGSIVPLGPAIEYTGQKPADTLTLYVYTGANASFTLYEDQGSDYSYEKGAWSMIPMHYEETTHTLQLDARQGSYPGMLTDRIFRIVWISPDHAEGLGLAQGVAVAYHGQTLTIHQ
jgi:alpha-D-xyloside xylohydrolase